jgi:peptidoglycan/xylan/chitin deacetylase (PgdA/CDA1 family)
MYHAVGAAVPDDIYGIYSICPKRFEEQMKSLSEYKLAGVAPLSDLPDNGISVTFDDGYKDNLDIAAPILVRYSIPFTVFIVPAFIKSGNSIYLSIAGLRELASIPGASIGAHGNTHCRLSDCKQEELFQELTDSRKWLEDTLGMAVTTMSYPHGAVNAKVYRMVAEAGYLLAATSYPGINRRDDNPLMLARTNIWAQDDVHVFHSKLNGHWDWLRFCTR